jgi:D-beta-D-heptose 7-phosphate kinase/D-beta-D-heptose 1-phosphate adenosyltransferase
MLSKDRQIFVVGDAMVDVYHNGVANRISPEAPVPIIENPKLTFSLGGAGNTAANIKSLGGSAVLVSVIGADDWGVKFIQKCEDTGISFPATPHQGFTTSSKHRFLAGDHQVVRIDYEDTSIPPSAGSQIGKVLEESEFSVLLISDYRKGVISEDLLVKIFARAQELSAPIIVDSKAQDFSIFEGASLLTPNLVEALRASGEHDPRRAAKKLHALTGADVLVTLGQDGMLLYSEGQFSSFPSTAVEVSDVTGAGDTVAAAIAIKLSEGATLVQAVAWANLAAAVAVGRVGTYSVLRHEV